MKNNGIKIKVGKCYSYKDICTFVGIRPSSSLYEDVKNRYDMHLYNCDDEFFIQNENASITCICNLIKRKRETKRLTSKNVIFQVKYIYKKDNRAIYRRWESYLISAIFILLFYAAFTRLSYYPIVKYTMRFHFLDGTTDIYSYKSTEEPTILFNKDEGYTCCGIPAVCRMEILKTDTIK